MGGAFLCITTRPCIVPPKRSFHSELQDGATIPRKKIKQPERNLYLWVCQGI
jgi:hypothetical protein